VDEAVAAHAEAERILAEQRAVRGAIEGRVAETRRTAATAEKNLEERRRMLAALEQRIALAEARRTDAIRRVAEIAEQSSIANAKLEELARKEQAGRAELAAASAEAADRKGAFDELERELTEATTRAEARRTELASLDRELRHLREMTKGLETQIDADRAAVERSHAERGEFERELAKLAAQDDENRARETELESEVTALRLECGQCEAALLTHREALEMAQSRLDEVKREALECVMARERARALSEELERNFSEKFQVAFDDVAANLEAALSERIADEDDRRLAELRTRAERIGEVNLAAESEVRELEEREASLNAEKADLETAVEDLSQTIQKLNREARRRFAETFEGAARNFAGIFPKLMRGGRGHLELEQGGDPLEAGVNIMVQPAGKKVREIGLLSGGEKALSAMALIFSLFLLNPSPFCVMDEVDAPLDEFSLAAFAGMIVELKERSQFIVITHNQRTMQRADQVHGVTMERPGISKVISMRIPQAA
jgi:chromosome segregation protein